MMRMQAQVDYSGQSGIDSYESYTKTLELKSDTTVEEIKRWAERSDMDGRVIRIVLLEEANDE